MKTGLEAQLLRASQSGNVSISSSQALQNAYNRMIKDIENNLYYSTGVDFGYSEKIPDQEEKKKKEESKKSLKNLLENT